MSQDHSVVDVRDAVEQCFANTKKLFCVPRITPELSRAESGEAVR